MTDKVLHSAVGLGSIVTVVLAYICLRLGIIEWMILIPIILAVGKETIDRIRGSKFDLDEVFYTLNPIIVIKWYLERIKR